MTPEQPDHPVGVLEYASPRPPAPSHSTFAGNLALLVFLIVYIIFNLIATVIDNFSTFQTAFIFALPAPLLCIVGAVIVQLVRKPRPFNPLLLIGFIIAIVVAGACILWIVGEAISSLAR